VDYDGEVSSPDVIPLGPFDLQETVGQGGMGEVWRAVHRRQQVPVAIKILSEQRARQPEAVEAFRNEVGAVAALSHPAVVMILDHGEVDAVACEESEGHLLEGSPYLAMELASGGSLALVDEILPWMDLKHVLLTMLDALAHAHARGVIHRDLKPGNVLLCTSGDVRPGLKLSDFGIAAALEEDGEDVDRVSGTLHYMAPEHILGRWRDHGPWTDLYALGCMAWRLAAGFVPFEGRIGPDLMRAQIREEPPDFLPLVSVPRGFDGWLRRLLAKRRGERYQRAADAAWALDQLGDADDSGPSVLRDYLRPVDGPLALAREHSTLAIEIPGGSSPATPASTSGRSGAKMRVGAPIPNTWERPIPPSPPMQLIGAGLGLYGLRTIPFVGREVERDVLWNALRTAQMNRVTELVLVHGASGTGKTRLVQWVCERGHELGAIHVLKIGGAEAPDALRRLVERFLRTTDQDRTDVEWRAKRFLGVHRTGLSALIEFLRPATAAERRNNPSIPRLETAQDRYKVVADFLAYVASDRPVLLFFDDVHDMRDALGLCGYLLRTRLQRPMPMLVAATARDDILADNVVAAARVDAVMRLPGARRLQVGPLSPREHAELVQALLGMEGSLSAQVEQRTKGNALFAVGLVGDWVARGLLNVGPGGFEILHGANITLPDAVRLEWTERLDRLLDEVDPSAGAYLEAAAALGLEVNMAEWRAVCPGRPTPATDEMRRELVERMLAQRLALARDDGWAFPNAMMKECVELRATTSGAWKQHNRRCVALLRHRMALGHPGVSGRLGRHLVAIGEWEDAVDTLLKGAEEIQDVGDQRAAMALLAACEDAMKHAELPPEDVRWGKVWATRTTLLRTLRRYHEASHWSRRVLEACREKGWDDVLPTALREQAMTEIIVGNLDAAGLMLEELEAWAVDRMLTTHKAIAHRGLGRISAVRGDIANARLLWHRAGNEFDLVGDEVGLAGCWCHLAVYGQIPDSHAEALYRQAMRIFERHNRLRDLAFCWNGLAEIARRQGDLKAAENGYREALLLHDRTGNDASVQQLNLALVQLRRGRFNEAHRVAESARRTLAATGRKPMLAGAHAALLPCMAVANEWVAFDHHLGRTRGLVRNTDFVDADLAWTLGLAGNLAARAREVERALIVYKMSLKQYERLGEDALAIEISARITRVSSP
jgi:eukaryotic-like serine/threonine-protein kinase